MGLQQYSKSWWDDPVAFAEWEVNRTKQRLQAAEQELEDARVAHVKALDDLKVSRSVYGSTFTEAITNAMKASGEK